MGVGNFSKVNCNIMMKNREEKTTCKNESSKQQLGIVLNRMYAGQYLEHNLGHEVINFFRADDGNHYLYLNAKGDFASEHVGKIGYMFLVKYHAPGVVEVVGMATGLEDVYKPENCKGLKSDNVQVGGELKYGGVSLSSLFQGFQQQNIFVTYKAAKVYVPVRRIFIQFANAAKTQLQQAGNLSSDSTHVFSKQEPMVVSLTALNQAKTSLKQYIYPSNSHLKGCDDYGVLYRSLIARCNDPELWQEYDGNIQKKSVAQRQPSLFDICQIQDNENCISNALAYFMMDKKYRELWKKFFKTKGIDHLDGSYWVEREYDISSVTKELNDAQDAIQNVFTGRIDLLLVDNVGDNLVVIENKIKSGVNSIAAKNLSKSNSEGVDSVYVNQLFRYDAFSKHVTNKETNCTFKHIYKYVLAPNYNIPEIPEALQEEYTILTYKDLHEYLIDNEVRKEWCEDTNFSAFVEAIRKHTYAYIGDYLRNEMEEIFMRKMSGSC